MDELHDVVVIAIPTSVVIATISLLGYGLKKRSNYERSKRKWKNSSKL